MTIALPQVLIAIADSALRVQLAGLIKEIGCQPHLAARPQAAQAILGAQPMDLLLVDEHFADQETALPDWLHGLRGAQKSSMAVLVLTAAMDASHLGALVSQPGVDDIFPLQWLAADPSAGAAAWADAGHPNGHHPALPLLAQRCQAVILAHKIGQDLAGGRQPISSRLGTLGIPPAAGWTPSTPLAAGMIGQAQDLRQAQDLPLQTPTTILSPDVLRTSVISAPLPQPSGLTTRLPSPQVAAGGTAGSDLGASPGPQAAPGGVSSADDLSDERSVFATILSLGVALSAEKDLNRLLERILLETMRLCNADAGTLYLLDEGEGGEGSIPALKFAMVHTRSLNIALGGTTGNEVPYPPLPLFDAENRPNESNVATYTALLGQPINIADIYTDEHFDFTGTKQADEQNSYCTISSLTIPLKNQADQVIGVMQLINALDRETGNPIPFSSYHQQVAESLASQAAVALYNRLLLDHQRFLTKIERDMEIASAIQANFLPESLPTSPGWEFEACFYPARSVAGDFYDVFNLPSQHPCLVIADVCDKGIGPALYMALTRSLIRAFAQEGELSGVHLDEHAHQSHQPSARQLTTLLDHLSVLRTVMRANDYLIDNHYQLNMFATLFLGVIDPESGVLTYINGGHNPPVIFNRDGLKTRLAPSGPAVGMLPARNFTIRQVQLEPGDFLFAFTDGVTDARSSSGTMFTDQRLLDILLKAAAEAPNPVDQGEAAQPLRLSRFVLDRVESELWDHMNDSRPGAQPDQYDDITMLVVHRQFTAATSQPGKKTAAAQSASIAQTWIGLSPPAELAALRASHAAPPEQPHD